ncbi:CoA-dependent acyltransferase [Polychaeton citri CBS 116435]|uniref:Dihydrolipoamide acetyltransferase component of pyruvate dehydrogenase complex n=1 Tax=Polychaeton citri CBS 116435 TaxID=1314669 RepID=A0A9P4QDD5_9PEZI|nr:CoA-dependent acyltransferase [Polychaeton citri CBS 116435]
MPTSRSAFTKAVRLTNHARPSVSTSSRRHHRAISSPNHVLLKSHSRQFHVSRQLKDVKPFLLADIGEGITECQLIQWFVQPGARVEQFDKLCEVQSDKASVEITSPFDGVIKKLHYEPDDMARTGKPLVDIDIQGEINEEDEAKLGGDNSAEASEAQREEGVEEGRSDQDSVEVEASVQEQSQQHQPRTTEKGHMGSLATPAVRHLVREHGLTIEDIDGSGRDGRVLKEDIRRHVSEQTQGRRSPSTFGQTQPALTRKDHKVPLSPVQTQMFKIMTKSLNIPHFLYTCSADLSNLTTLRKRLNTTTPEAQQKQQKFTHLPFILKALSVSLTHHPLLNSSLDTSDPKKPSLTYKAAHNIGVAVDTPSGLLVPVIRNVQDLSIRDISTQLRQISEKARSNRLQPNDFSGASFTVSNIGNIGGGVVAPVISEPQIAILGIGRSKIVPAFDEKGDLVKREELVFSWSADHRVVDGAECARCAERVKDLLEDPGSMLVELQ